MSNLRDCIAAVINDHTMVNDEGFVQNSEHVADKIMTECLRTRRIPDGGLEGNWMPPGGREDKS